ncbi:MAG: hemolysin family protein [Coraliomargaritaceae bacterium]
MSFLLLSVGITLVFFLHACLVLCETSMVKIRYGMLDEAALKELRRRAGLAHLLDNGDLVGRVFRIGKLLCTMGLGLQLALLMERVSVLLDETNVIIVVVFFGAFFGVFLIHLFFAEIFPRGIAMRDPAMGLLRSYRILILFRWLTLPVILLLGRLKQMHFKRIGVEKEDELNPLDVDVQIRAMGEDSTELSPVVRKIFDRTLQMQDLVVHDILLPRNQAVVYDLGVDFDTNLRAMKDAGHTRFPLCQGDLDNCVGIIHIKDIFRWGGDPSRLNPLDLKRSISQFSQETPLEEALQRMLRAKFHMALVTDEFGRVIGLVTLETILESLVGDIQDEFDSDEELLVPLRKPDTYKVSGLTPLHDIEEALALEINNDDVSTIGGLVSAQFGYIPSAGEILFTNGMRITVVEVNERRVISVEIEKELEQSPQSGNPL